MVDAPTISTHVLDTEHGRPAAGVWVTLYRVAASGGQKVVGRHATDNDGRIRRLLDLDLQSGEYRLEFEVEGPFFRHLSVIIRVDDPGRSYHVPLLLAPYSMTAYRGG